MSTTVFINALGMSEFAYKSLPGGENSFNTCLNVASRLPDVDRIVVIAGQDFSGQGDYTIVYSSGTEMNSLLSVFKDESGDSENIFYFYGDTPLVDPLIAERMYKNHNQYFASYTFADGYPQGMAPEILRKSVLDQFIKLAEQNQITIGRKSIFELIQKDINSYDIETEISSIDQRMLRVSLSADTKRNFNQLCRIIEALEGHSGYFEDALVNLLEKKQELLRTEPSFINVQITGGCPQSCSYCPYPGTVGDVIGRTDEMTLDQWKMILSKVKQFSNDAVFSISLWGEPSLHSEILRIFEELLKIKNFRLIVETSGISWDHGILKSIQEIADGRVEWILSLDAQNPESYKKLRGRGWEEVNKTAVILHELFGDKLFIQSVRMKDQEEYLEDFYRSWKDKGFNVIIQKHDHFCGVLPDLRVTDLSPVKRFPCWHIKRDLNILLDGTVPICREDLKNEYILGNIFKDEIVTLWKKGDRAYLDHLSGNYPVICRECDEYYTYNF
jgi:spiro-SPASM protein